jgi:hypothetical protein
METRELLTIEEMAALLKVPISWLYSRTRLKGCEAMPGVLRIGKYLRFEPDTVINYIKQKYSETNK